MTISNKLYDVLKWICIVCLPALATFLNILLPAVGVVPETAKTVITIVTALATFIGMLIGISTAAYKAEK